MSKRRIAIVAALPREIAGLVRDAKPDPALLRRGVHLYRAGDLTLAAAGMGAPRATLAFAAAMQAGDIEMVVSAGLAGACSPELRAGELVEADVVIDAMTGERFACDGARNGDRVLVTSDSIAGVREKARLRESYNAMIVDMEAATVARLAAAHGLRFRAIKGVSDAHDFEMESLRRFADARGQFRTAAFALHTALRPGTWSAAMRLGRDSRRALEAMWAKLRVMA